MSRSSSSNNASNSSRSKQSTNQTSSKSPKKQTSVDQMKYEIAGELGVELGPDATARENGKVGAEVRARTSTNKASRNKSSNSK